MSAATYDVERLRLREFPWAAQGDAIYLNNAAVGPLPTRTAAAIAEWTALRTQPYRLTKTDEFEVHRRSRELCARLIGADAGEIALTVNTSYGINLAARALPLAAGDVVLIHDREFPANVYPWMALEAAGIELRRVPCIDRLPDEDALLAMLDEDDRVRAVSVSWVQFANGARADLARVGAACRARGVWFVVDAIQGLGALPLDVGASHIDVLACGAQKWLMSPWGTGFTYVRRELVPRLLPHAVGWMSVQGSDDFNRLVDYDFTYRDDARRFEVITLPTQDFAGMNASLDLLLELGPAAVSAHVTALVGVLVDGATNRGLALATPVDATRRAGIVSIVPRDPVGASERLAAAGVSHSLREGAVRLSPHCYNTREEVERALALLA